MNKKNPKVDEYLIEGCGRCPLVGTPKCKVNDWREELVELRRILLETGLTEDRKWGSPCYTWENSNVVMLSAFRDFYSVSFFKGVLLNDPDGMLTKPGPYTQAVRLIRFTSLGQLIEMEPALKGFISQAIEVEKAGLKVEFKKNPEPIPEELEDKFFEDPAFEAAFYALTPGRQRGYILYFSAAKQSKTRISRIEKHMQRILDGKGIHDR
jgi:uncharacterized protein YdeI (YjbR/CyaY-like superfamily)